MDFQKYTKRSAHPVRNFLKYAIPVVLAFIALQYAVLSAVAVRNKMKLINEQVDVKLSSINNGKVDSTYLELFKEKAWLETRFQIAKTDSISLSINLKDSILQLELKGVVLKTSKITDYEADEFFYQLNPGAYHHLFGVQAQAGSDFSTIRKSPLIIKKAPKDTSEVQITAAADTSKIEAVHWMLALDNGIIIKIEGADSYSRSDWWVGTKFWFRQDILKTGHDLRKTIRFETPVYVPEIRLVISDADAKAIYRALPAYPLIYTRF